MIILGILLMIAITLLCIVIYTIVDVLKTETHTELIIPTKGDLYETIHFENQNTESGKATACRKKNDGATSQ